MIGCAVAVVFSAILGAVWYSHRLPTGRLWMKRHFPGKSPEQIGKDVGPAIMLTLVANGILNLLLRFILIFRFLLAEVKMLMNSALLSSDFFHATSILAGLKFGIGLSCLAILVQIPHVLYSKGYIDVFVADRLFDSLVIIEGCICNVYFG